MGFATSRIHLKTWQWYQDHNLVGTPEDVDHARHVEAVGVLGVAVGEDVNVHAQVAELRRLHRQSHVG